LRQTLGDLHGVDPDQVVPGSGAAELIHRLVRLHGGTVQHRRPGFGEYAHAARCAELPTFEFDDPAGATPRPGTLFVCLPDNPDGHGPTPEVLAALAKLCDALGTCLVLDLAYLPFLASPPALPPSAVHLYAPNKAAGLTGVRAAYAVVPDPSLGRNLAALAPSWVVGTEGLGFLEAVGDPDARAWLDSTAPQARRLRSHLASVLRGHGFETRESEATHLVARHPEWTDSGELAARLREAGVRVRDTTSMGLPGWVRLAARPETEIERLDQILTTFSR
jgi:histidinol-phosphate aminotransferase